MIVAVGSDRAAKLSAVKDCITRIATVDDTWSDATILGRPVKTDAPAMPLNDQELMHGAEQRARAVRLKLADENLSADIYVGLEGGFHSLPRDGRIITFLRGWAYAFDGELGYFGASPSISVPAVIANRVIDECIELGDVIDQVANENDVRSRQGAWGVLSKDLLTRSMSFETALLGALAPFYNVKLYSQANAEAGLPTRL